MEKHVIKLDSFPAEDGHIESVLVGVQEIKVSFQDWRARKIVIIFYGVEEFHGFDSGKQCIVSQDIGEFTIQKMENGLNDYSFIGAWDESTFLKIKGKDMEIYEVGIANDINSALFAVGAEDDIDFYYIFHLTYSENNMVGYPKYIKFKGILEVREYIEQAFVRDFL